MLERSLIGNDLVANDAVTNDVAGAWYLAHGYAAQDGFGEAQLAEKLRNWRERLPRSV